MCCTRTFYNVGYALFAVERVSDKTVVYDCGGQDQKLIESAISRAFKKNEEIEAVFISHYDRDHINGLFLLLNYCKVKRLILPNLCAKDKLFVLCHHNLTKVMREFIVDPITTMRAECKDKETPHISFVNIESGEGRLSFDEATECLSSGIELFIRGIPFWVYIPYNIMTIDQTQYDSFITALYAELNSRLGITVARTDDIKTVWTKYNLCDKINEVKKAYMNSVKIPNNKAINAYSQVLYSGCNYHSNEVGCLYLGDFDAKNNFPDLYRRYKSYCNTLRVIQIPHHGSSHNFNRKLIKPNNICVIPANKIISSKKPSYNNVVLEIARLKGIPIITGYWGDVKICCCCYDCYCDHCYRSYFGRRESSCIVIH